jgi:hypothetical protein
VFAQFAGSKPASAVPDTLPPEVRDLPRNSPHDLVIFYTSPAAVTSLSFDFPATRFLGNAAGEGLHSLPTRL